MKIKVLVNGAQGKMGQEAVEAIDCDPSLQLVGRATKSDHLPDLIHAQDPDVVLDLTTPQAVYENTKTILEQGKHPVIGTSGLTTAQIQEFETFCAEHKRGALIVPNFSISAILMLQFAKQAARFLPHAEIIEMHHAQKKDKPSGTAIQTANLIEAVSQQKVPIHSVRLPALTAHQTVILSGDAETLSIRQDSYHRKSFMPGILFSCKQVVQLDELVYGLEDILQADQNKS